MSADGYFDLQVNGYGGVDFNRDGLSAEDLERACRRLADDGPTLLAALGGTALWLLRLALAAPSGLENPTLGSWEAFSKTEGIVCTTGWPFNIPGTVEPLVTLVVRGNLDLIRILEDTFRMAQLCWPTPTGCMRLPVDLKLCDEHLRAFAGRADEDKALFGESEEEDEEPLLAAIK